MDRRERMTNEEPLCSCTECTLSAPGSDSARLRGCTCPVLDNAHGEGYLGGIAGDDGHRLFVRRMDCAMHGEERHEAV